MPSRGVAAVQAVTRTIVSPDRTMTDPSACLARRPVSIEMVCPPTEISRVCMSVFLSMSCASFQKGSGLKAQGSEALSPPEPWVLSPEPLLADAQALDQFRIPIRVLPLQVVQQTPALTNELEKAAAGVMIFRVGLEMFRKVADALAEERDLYLGGSGVRVVCLVGADDFRLAILGKRH